MSQLDNRPSIEIDREWDEFVARFPHGSILQSSSWARLKRGYGWRPQRIWLRKEGKLVAGAQVLIRTFALGLIRIGYIPHGPLVDWRDKEQVAVFFGQLDRLAYDHRLSMVKFEPLLWESSFSTVDWVRIAGENGFDHDSDTIQPPRTIVVSLDGSDDEILARMRQKTRYNIRLAARKGVTVRQGTINDLEMFAAIMRQTSIRDRFAVHTKEYYGSALASFQPGKSVLLVAEYEGRPLAALMAFICGDQAAYLYGASSELERQRMPAYALQWAAIQWARSNDCRSYDLWGVPDLDEDKLEQNFTERSDGLWGVYRFKRGFGGEVRRTVGAGDRIYNKIVYGLYQRVRNRRHAAPATVTEEEQADG